MSTPPVATGTPQSVVYTASSPSDFRQFASPLPASLHESPSYTGWSKLIELSQDGQTEQHKYKDTHRTTHLLRLARIMRERYHA